MPFEQTIRDRISKSAHGSVERSILKVVLGDVQQKSALAEFTEDMGQALVKRMIKANDETIPHLGQNDPRRAKLLEENQVLGTLLPQYWSAQQVRERLEADGINIKGAKNDGQAIGLAMQHLKKLNAPVDGQTVKEAVADLRKA